MDQPVTSKAQYEVIMLGLLSLFPEADQSCKNPSRFFLGCKHVTILDDKPVSAQSLIDRASLMLINSDRRGRSRKIPANLLKNPQSGQ